MNNMNTAQGQAITITNNGITNVVTTSGGMQLVGRVANMDEDDDDDDMGDEGDDSFGEDDEMMGVSDVTSQLAAAGWQHGPVGVAAAAAIASSKRKRKSHTFETNPSIRKRQQTRLLRKLKAVIDEFSVRVGQQAIVLVATPGKPVNNFRAFGAKPLEDVVRNLKTVIMSELETALSQQAPPPSVEDPNLHELPPIVIDGIPTPVEKMTQAQLRAFIPLMLKYSTGRGKPGWGKESTKPPWWPKHVPWANVRMDARNDEEKSKQISWTHALREIVINCYKYHGRDDLLPKFSEEEDLKRVQVNNYGPTVVQTISNPDGTVSIIHVDPNNPVITLPDGTTAQVQLHDAGSVHTLAEVATSDNSQTLQGTHEIQTNEHGHILITGEDGNTYPVQVSGHQLVTVNPNMYQTVVANIQGGGDGGQQVQVLGTPIQISGLGGNLQGLVMKTEPGEGAGGGQHNQGLTITPVSMAQQGGHHSIGGLGGQHFSVLQMGGEGGQQIITMRQRSPEHRDNTPDTTS